MDVSIGNLMKNFEADHQLSIFLLRPEIFNLRFSDSSRLKSGRALTTGEKANFNTYVMIWASAYRNSSIDSLPQGNGSTGSSSKHLLLLKNFP